MQRDFKGIWIPREIWLNQELGWVEKLMLTEIDSLDNENGCYASNDYFAKFFNVSKRRVIDVINNLEEHGFITKQMIYKKDSKQIEKRIIQVVKKSSQPQCRKVHDGSEGKFTRGSEENCTDNNTSFNNTFNNTFNKRNIVEQSPTIPFSEIVNYLNERSGSSYKSTGKKTQTLIKARFKEGFTVEDFKTVIDKKVSQWSGTNMSAYLRPETLFGTKFEGYLNEQVGGFNYAKPIANNGNYDSSGLELL